MELTPENYARMVAALKEGKRAPDGPIVEKFNPLELASAIESECARTSQLHGQRVSLHMDPQDALLLARFLRFRGVG